MQIALFEMKKIDQGPGKKVITPSMYVIYSTPIMRSQSKWDRKFFEVEIQFLQFHEILSSFISILCWTKRKYLRIRKVKSSGFIKVLTQLQSLIIFCASAEIFETFFFQLLLPGKTLHVSQGTFAKKFWTYFLLLTVLILEYFFA